MGLSVRALGAAVGKARNTMIKHETGETPCSAETIYALARALHTTPSYFFAGFNPDADHGEDIDLSKKIRPDVFAFMEIYDQLSKENKMLMRHLARSLLAHEQSKGEVPHDRGGHCPS